MKSRKYILDIFGYKIEIDYGNVVKINYNNPKFADEDIKANIVHYLLQEGFLNTTHISLWSWNEEMEEILIEGRRYEN